MKKVAWSGRKELGDSTLLVVVAVIIIGGLVGIFDAIWWWILQLPWLFGK
jgi:preprotein translocase SecE subunit